MAWSIRLVLILIASTAWTFRLNARHAMEYGMLTASARIFATSTKKAPPVVHLSQFNGTGVTIFMHIPKTGGTTVRRIFRPGDKDHQCPGICSYPKNSFTRPQSKESWDQVVTPRIEGILNGTLKDVYFVELHGLGGDGPNGLAKLQPYITKWKQMSIESGIPFFPFTIVREPASFYVSYFLFYRNHKCTKAWCEREIFKPEDLTEANLVRTAHSDQQSKFLMGMKTSGTFTSQNMTILQELLQDWAVYTTEDISSISQLLNKRILNNKKLKSRKTASSGKFKKVSGLSSKSLSNATKASLNTISPYDSALYTMVQQQQQQQKTTLASNNKQQQQQ